MTDNSPCLSEFFLFFFRVFFLLLSIRTSAALRVDVTGEPRRMNEQRWWAAAHSQSTGVKITTTLGVGFLSHYRRILVSLRFSITVYIWSSDRSLDRSSIHSNSSLRGAPMARGEGAEQCAATLLATKPLNADIKTAQVRNSHFIYTLYIVAQPLACARQTASGCGCGGALSGSVTRSLFLSHAPPAFEFQPQVRCRHEPSARRRGTIDLLIIVS